RCIATTTTVATTATTGATTAATGAIAETSPSPLGEGRQESACSQNQEPHDRKVDQVPRHAIHERGAVRTREVEDAARHPPAERHAEHRAHDDRADARAGLGGREMLAHDDRVRGHDPALEKPEQGRD